MVTVVDAFGKDGVLRKIFRLNTCMVYVAQQKNPPLNFIDSFPFHHLVLLSVSYFVFIYFILSHSSNQISMLNQNDTTKNETMKSASNTKKIVKKKQGETNCQTKSISHK